jgi:hypothetical protein
VRAEYGTELSWLQIEHHANWEERRDGLAAYAYYALDQNIGLSHDLALGNTKLFENKREAIRAHDKERIVETRIAWVRVLCTLLTVAIGLYLVYYHLSAILAYTLLLAVSIRIVLYKEIPGSRPRLFSLVQRNSRAVLFIEEMIKSIRLGAEVLGAVEVAMSVFAGTPSLGPYFFHTRQAKRLPGFENWWQRFEEHWRINNDLSSDDFFQLAYNTAVETGQPMQFLYNAVEYPASCEVPALLQGRDPTTRIFRNKRVCLNPTPLGTEPLFHETAAPGYRAMQCLTNTFKVGNTKNNLAQAFFSRLLKTDRPRIDRSTKREILAVTEHLVVYLSDHYEVLSRSDWSFDLSPKHRLREQNTLRAIEQGNLNLENHIFLKSNERLPLKSTDEGPKFVPRCIINCSDYMWYMTGPSSKALQNALASLYNGHHQRVLHDRNHLKTVSHRLYYTCGATADSLSDFWKRALATETNELFLLGLGDDGAGKICLNGHNIFFENDFGAYDVHQTGPWLKANRIAYASCDEEGAALWQDMYDAPWTINLGEYAKYLPDIGMPLQQWFHRNMRMTGENLTSAFNTLNNFTATLIVVGIVKEAVLKHPESPVGEVATPELFEAAYKSLGLPSKTKVFVSHKDGDHFPPLTYLKGTFLPDKHLDPVWVPLPSRVAKMGMFCEDPLVKDRRRLPRHIKLGAAVWSQWHSFGSQDHLTPQHARISDHLRRLSDSNALSWNVVYEDWHIRRSRRNVPLDHHHFVRFLEQRYGLTYDDWVSCVNTICSIKTLPCIWQHDAAWQFYQVDYC